MAICGFTVESLSLQRGCCAILANAHTHCYTICCSKYSSCFSFAPCVCLWMTFVWALFFPHIYISNIALPSDYNTTPASVLSDDTRLRRCTCNRRSLVIYLLSVRCPPGRSEALIRSSSDAAFLGTLDKEGLQLWGGDISCF